MLAGAAVTFFNTEPVKTYVGGKEVIPLSKILGAPDPTPEDLERQGHQALMNIIDIANETEKS